MPMQDLNLVLRLKADGSGFIGEVKQSSAAIAKLGTQGQSTARQLSATERQLQQFTTSVSSLKSGVLGLVGGFSALGAATAATRTLAQYQDMRVQISTLVGGYQQWLETEQYLIGVAAEHNKVLLDMTGSYARLATLQEAGLLKMDESRAIFEGMSNVQSATGASSAQLGQAMYGLSQALASPIVRAEELNQVVEPLPGLLNKLDKAAQLPAGGFRRMMLEGQVTSSFFKTTLLKALEDYEGAAASLNDNINAQFARVTNAYQQAVVAFEAPISEGISPVLSAIASGLSALSENADGVSTVFGVTFSAAIARGTVALGSYGKTQLTQIAAARAATASTIAAAQAEERRALAAKATALSAAQASAAEARLTAARLTLATATNSATLASRGLNMVMGLLGGPAGLAMMAVSALGYFALSSDDAEQSTLALSAATDTLNGSLSELSQAQLAVAKLDNNKAIAALEADIRRVNALIEKTPTTLTISSYTTGGKPMEIVNQRGIEQITRATAELETLNGKLAEQKTRLSEINRLMSGSGASPEPSNSASPEPANSPEADSQAQKLLDKLEAQVALYGQSGEAAKLRYEIESGSLSHVNTALQQQLLAEAQKLDALNAQTEALKQQSAAQAELEAMQRQLQLGERPSQVQQVRYELNHGDLQGIDSKQQQQLLEAAAQLDAQLLQQQQQAKGEAFAQELAQIQQQNEQINALKFGEFALQREQEEQAHEERLERLTEQFDEVYELYAEDQEKRAELEGQFFQAQEQLNSTHQGKMTQIDKAEQSKQQQLQQQQLGNYSALFDGMAGVAEGFAGDQSGVYQGLFAVSKAFSIAESIMAIQTGIAKAWELGFPAGIPAAAAVVSQTASIISTIQGTTFQGQAHDGISRVPAQNEGTWLLRKDEMVMSPQQTDNFEWMVAMMAQLQQGLKRASLGSASNSLGVSNNGGNGGGNTLTVRFEGLPEGYQASSSEQQNGDVIALIQASAKQTENNTYHRVATDMARRTGAVGRAMGSA